MPNKHINPQLLSQKVAIIGAGPGGLAAAIALANLGLDVQVYEKAQDLRPAGTGLGLSPNGLNCLEAISPGIINALTSCGCLVRRAVVKSMTGETIKINPTTFSEKYGQPLLTVWWWRLQQTLASRLSSAIIHLNHRCIGFQQDEDGVEIYFEHGKTEYADLLIGADGLHSAVRETLFSEGKPNYLGSMCWRAVVEYHHELFDSYDLVFVKGNQQFMFLLNVGGGYTSWISRKFIPNYTLSQNAEQVKARILDELTGWDESFRAVVEATPAGQIWEGPICDRPPLTHWSKNRVTLLGDAAHPMAPAMAQGANSTFEDVCELQACLSQAASLTEALTTYEQRRIQRTSLIQARSAVGEMRYYDIDAVKQTQEQAAPSHDSFPDWLYSYKPPAVL
ncbi:FAD-dependent oxidoreductase [Anabaena sp. CA = ATCC 33047]|uniref:FAD-dependent oxidoreductase n=1 Tax=Anabaena sp. (strain CA / ATCC 33047) TaxID=52271 RepID=UPI00083445B2|nr:FAD-dependent monooxygenase [Anabaena sp. CA = ATCC 33047]